jgi:hypothetical protein
MMSAKQPWKGWKVSKKLRIAGLIQKKSTGFTMTRLPLALATWKLP